jgi:nucleotide-binding universal stress UspA family protein
MLKDVLVCLDNAPGLATRLDVALAMAAAHDAHLAALHVIAATVLPAYVAGQLPADLVAQQKRFLREDAARLVSSADAAARRAGRSIEIREVEGDIVSTALLHARHADLTIVGQTGGESAKPSMPAPDLPETLMLESGRPVLVVPRFGRFTYVGERVLLAWNGGREAARAANDALPILARAHAVTVLSVNPKADAVPRHPGADIGAHLARHGVKVEVDTSVALDIDVGDALLSRAADLSCDLIVMGAYGRSRMREWALGGATRHLLRHMTVPVLFSH